MNAKAPSPDCGPSVAGSFPLSFVQESLWTEEQLAPGTPRYNMPEAWRFTGDLDPRVLQASLSALVRRHEPLRTAIRASAGRAEQVVFQPAEVELPEIELASSPDPEDELARRLHEEAGHPFDLGASLFRTRLFRLGPADHVLSVTLHHLVSDGWSQTVFARELGELYSAKVQGREPQLAQPGIQYADFAVWQREELTGAALDRPLAYWKRRLAGPLPIVELPSDRPRPAVPSGRGKTDFAALPEELADGLKRLSRAEGVTLGTSLLAGFAAWMHRTTGMDDIIVGCPFAGRERAETEALIGYFVNTQALRLDLGGNPTVRDLLRRVRTAVFEATEHQHVPPTAVLQAVRPERKAGHPHPLFQVVFGFQGTALDRLVLPGVSARRFEVANDSAKFDWTLLVTQTAEGLTVRSEHATDLFDPATIAAFLKQWHCLLEGMTKGTDVPVDDLPLMTERERKQVIALGQTCSPYEREASITGMFEDQAASHPDSVALLEPSWPNGPERGIAFTPVSYSELNNRANRLARRLQECGTGPGTRVAVCMERSPDLVVALLGILKAGAAYVPIDPDSPRERVRFICRDSSATLLVTKGYHWRADAQPIPVPGIATLDLESDFPRLSQFEPANLGVQSGELAYVMYTSGSTGEPKGVAVPHRAILRLVRHADWFTCNPSEVFLSFAPIAFDASTFEIWAPLLNGARLAIAPPGRLSLADLGRVIQEASVTTLWLTSGLFNQMVEEHADSLRGLRQLLAGGEALSVPHVLKALRDLTGCRLINGYGPTENTTFTCCYNVPPRWTCGRSVPIGRPISNTSVLVLDPRGQPVPPGIPGELYAGGDGLACGYVNHPELTARKFVPLPHIPEVQNPRWYRTGDRVRWLADGQLEFLGRLDDQIKIRGYRVEPGEIEHVLRAHRSVRQAAVAAWGETSERRVLAAYVVWRNGSTDSVESLRQHLASRLPDAMIPPFIVPVDVIPLTANGKVNRRALPDPRALPVPGEAPHAPPRNPTETCILSIWTEVLGRNGFGVHDNFFHLGGHSLLATQVISRVTARLAVDLPVSALFNAPTVAALSDLVTRQRPARGWSKISQSRREALQLLERLDQLTDAEVENLLSDPHFDRELT